MNDLPTPSVLIVEDETDFRDLLAFEFSMKGYTVHTAPNGQRALDLVREQVLNVVITDIRMPEIDGLELLRHIKSANVHTPAVVCTSAYADILPEHAYQLGADGVFMKPFRLAALVETVRWLTLPMAKRWAAPPPELPLRQVRLEIPSLEAAENERKFALGRGGICLAIPDTPPLLGRRLAFDVTLAQPPVRRMVGTGLIRWFRPGAGPTAAPACGIEFEYLDDESRDSVIQWTLDQAPLAYIPSLDPR